MNKIIIHIGVCLALILFLAATDAVIAIASTTFPACTGGETTETVSFVHLGDLHANFDLVDDKYSKIRAYLDAVRSGNPYTLFTNAGDDHEKGSVAEQYSNGDAAMEATFAMQFDVRTIGNHDFAWGVDHLLAFSHDPYGIVLASNTTYTVDPSAFGAVQYGEIQVGCVKIGFFGMVGPPWNELDEQIYHADSYYLPGFLTETLNSNYVAIAQSITDTLRNTEGVDAVVMVSHLGNYVDQIVAQNVTGIDLILGGHSHQTPREDFISNGTGTTLVALPDFYGDGLTQVDMTVDLVSHGVSTFSYQEVLVADLKDIDTTVHDAISSIISTYAPHAQDTICYLKNPQDNDGNNTTNTAFATIAAKAAIEQYPVDAALLDPARADPWGYWPAGPVSTQELLDGYYIERQPSDTPGINALYMAEVSGEDLQLMTSQTPSWVYAGPAPVAGATYKVILHKGAALDPAVFFPGVIFSNVSFVSETYETLAQYGANRTNGCLYLDTDVQLTVSPCNAQLIDGACGTASGSNFPSAPASKLCGAGIASTVSGSGPWTWGCIGLNGGSIAGCSANKMIIGVCGISNGGNFTSAPASDLCTTGAPTSVTGNGPWYWDCTGSNGGSTANCSANTITDGACGTASGSSFASAPATNLCDAGSPTAVTGSGPWIWDCTGLYGGTTAACLAYLIVDGTCGTANGSNFYSEPTSNLCSAGTTGTVSGIGPWAWDCTGLNGGIIANCSANIITDGACGTANGSNFYSEPATNLCSAGNAGSVTGNGPWAWDCAGVNGGTIANCSANIITDGTCGTANGGTFSSAPTINLCSAGTEGTVNGTGPWNWDCTGSNGGATASCSANIQTYTVTPSAGANGSISPNTAQVVSDNGTTSFTITPDIGYGISSITGCNGTLTGSSYTTGPITADCTVTASFTINTYTITASSGANGSISSAGTTTVNYGTNMNYTITPNAGYHVLDVLVDGSSVGALTSYQFTTVTANHTIAASFAINTYTVTPSVGANGSISPDTPQIVSYNATTSITITPDTGYSISSITGCNGTLAGNIFTTGPMTTDCTVTASFAQNDVTPPIVTLSTPVDNSYTSSSSLVVSGSASDNVGVTSVLVNGSGVIQNPDTSFSKSLTLNAGVNTITIIASDAAGNQTTIARTVTYDGSAPSIAITSPGQDIITASNTMLVDGTASDDLTTVSVVISDGTNTFIPAVASGSFGQQITFPSEGQYVITATAMDQAGNSSSVTRTISYIRFGDLDSSGVVSAEDALRALRIAAGLIQPSATDLMRGDVAPLVSGMPQPDGKVDIGDVVVILRKAVGLSGW